MTTPSAAAQQRSDISRLLAEFTHGRREVLDDLMPLVYDELRQIASRRLRDERSDHTLNTTALVHEAYIEMAGFGGIELESRAHFFALAARAMRRVLVDYAVRRNALKRGGIRRKVTLEEVPLFADERGDDVLALDEALTRLGAIRERHARVVECRFFGGMSIEETAEVLGVSPATIKREWTMARAWLNRELSSA
jgi:RNA polymerase sigma-70 factor, ECF subfamily